MSRFFKQLWEKNPARVVAHLLALVPLTFGLLAAFGVVLSGEQQTAISGFLVGLSVLMGVGGEVIRSQVTPMSRAANTQAELGRLQHGIDAISGGATTPVYDQVRRLQTKPRG